MTFSDSIQSELLKTRRTSGWYLVVALSAFTAVLMAADFYATPANEVGQFIQDPWTSYLSQGFRLTNAVILPLLIILVCTLLPQLEYRNNAWKQVLASPQPKLMVFLAKYAVVLLFLLMILASLNFFVIALTPLIDYLRDDNLFQQHPIPVQLLISLNGRTFVCALGISALQFWAGLRFRSFITPIAIGLGLWFIGVALAFELKVIYADLHPYLYPIFVVFERFRDVWSLVMWRSIGCTVVVLGLAYLDFQSPRSTHG